MAASIQERVNKMRKDGAKLIGKDFEDHQKEIEALENSMPKIPIAPVIFVDDITSEALCEQLQNQNERLAIFSDESGIFEIMAGKYNQGIVNFDVYLKSHSGSYLSVNRKGNDKPPIILRSPALTMCLAIQPTVLKDLAAKPQFAGRGLLARFLFFVPKSKIGTRIIDPPEIPEKARKNYNELILRILNTKPIVNPETDEEIPYKLYLSKEALSSWEAYFYEVEKELKPHAVCDTILGWSGKAPGAAIRLAGLFHVASHTKPQDKEISADTMERAINLTRLISQHTKFAFNIMEKETGIEYATKVLNWILNGKYQKFDYRTCCQSMKSRLRAEQVKEGLSVLLQRYYIFTTISEKSEEYRINPQLVCN